METASSLDTDQSLLDRAIGCIEVFCDEYTVISMAVGLSFVILYQSGMGFGYSLLAAPLGS